MLDILTSPVRGAKKPLKVNILVEKKSRYAIEVLKFRCGKERMTTIDNKQNNSGVIKPRIVNPEFIVNTK